MNTAVDMVSLTAPVKRFVSQSRQALIDGRWQDAQSGGWGREMGSEVLKNYLETKSVCMSV